MKQATKEDWETKIEVEEAELKGIRLELQSKGLSKERRAELQQEKVCTRPSFPTSLPNITSCSSWFLRESRF
jgi:hypothetical protein